MAIPPNPPPAPLACHGGQATFPQGPPTWPLSDAEVAAALQEALAEGSWGRYHGPAVPRLEETLARQHAGRHVLTCCSGTLAVELALRALQIGPDMEVVLAGYDFPGNFRAVEAVGARPVLVDVQPDTWSLSAEALSDAFSSQTAAIVVSHLHGGLADMPRIRALADAQGVPIVEDVCQAPGASIAGRPAGTWGDIGVLSFGGSKLLSAGRGGALLLARESDLQRARIYNQRGNEAFPLSELQAAVLVPQLDKLAARNQTRWDNVRRLWEACRPLAFLHPVTVRPQDQPSFYKLAWRFEPPVECGVTRDAFLRALQAEGVAMDSGFRGFVRRGPARCRKIGTLQASRQAADQTVLLHHPVLLQPAPVLQRVADALHKVAWHLGLL